MRAFTMLTTRRWDDDHEGKETAMRLFILGILLGINFLRVR